MVLYGWDTGEASLETVLSNADKFAEALRRAGRLEEAEAVADALGRRFRRTEVVTIDGGQPVHDYIIVLE